MKIFQRAGTYQLESGQTLENVEVAYHTFGKLNEDKSNVVWVCHALTANSDVFEWWPGLFGENDHFNPTDHFIVCANFLGSHYGTTGPLSENPRTGRPFYHDFPEITIRDMLHLHIDLAEHLGIDKIQVLIGGSMGGHQALEWAITEPNRIEQLVLLATSAVISPWANAYNHTQRMAIATDSTWKTNLANAGEEGLKAARAIALLSYRNQSAYNNTQKEDLQKVTYPERAASYQDYQGIKLNDRFNAFSYWHISKAMDSHNVGRDRIGVTQALNQITARTLILSIESDLLFPYEEQEFLKQHIANAELTLINSNFGHDGFLIETEKIANAITVFESQTATIK